MARPSNSRLVRVMIVILVIGALIWIVAFTGINLSSKNSMEKSPTAVPSGANAMLER
jgi:cytoskeletal protein RodZ